MAAGCGGAHAQRSPRGAVYRRRGLLPRAQHALLTQTVHKKRADPVGQPSSTEIGVPNMSYTYCISSNNSAIVLSYQWLPTSIQCGEAMARRRKEDGRVGSASRGMVRRWGRFFSRVRPRVSQIARGGLLGATPRGQPWTSAVTLPPGRNGLIAWRMAVLSTLREPSLCRHVHRALLRSVWLDVTPRITTTACNQGNNVERYSRSMRRSVYH